MSWINILKKFPSNLSFASTQGEGSPLCVDDNSGIAYYLVGKDIKPLYPPPIYTTAGYGALGSNTPVAIALGATWTPLENYQNTIAQAVGIIQNPVAGTLQVTDPGIYLVTASWALTFDEANNGRSYNVRLFGPASSSTLGQWGEYVGRNAGGSTTSIAVLAIAGIPNQMLRLDFGGGDTFTNCMRNDIQFAMTRISN